MRKGRTVIGQDVYSLADGRRVQSVKDLIVSDDHDSIVALLVDEGGLLGTSTIVPIESVYRFGPDAVMVDTVASVVPASSDARVAVTLDRKASLLGTTVVTTEGERVGQIGDMYFDEASGAILGYEVSGGVLGDVLRGASWLPRSSVEIIGPDAVIASPEAAEIVASQVGGVQGALESVGQPAMGADDASRPASEQDAASGQAQAPDDPDGILVGRRATTDVTDQTGSVVVANGQRVTLEHVERAREEGGLDALYASAGVERPVPVSEQMSKVMESASESASDLWGRFTARLSEMTDSAGKRLDTQQTKAELERIHDAIGRPVTKVFLDREDTVILDLGDLITHQAVQRAYDAGMLDSLLASVYKAPQVTFSQDQLKARVAGDSTIEQASGGATVVDELEGRIAEADAQPDEDDAPETGGEEAEEQPAEADGAASPQTAEAAAEGVGQAESSPDGRKRAKAGQPAS